MPLIAIISRPTTPKAANDGSVVSTVPDVEDNSAGSKPNWVLMVRAVRCQLLNVEAAIITGSTDVKIRAASVIDRSTSSISISPSMTRRTVRPGGVPCIQPLADSVRAARASRASITDNLVDRTLLTQPQ
ncbi:hypothetical protein GFS60_00658 [Rhodococcus sp. WAY2]|nr:hypothetical protein GFS60_00658 [Rhodococcus sp. WAY2]